MWDLRNWLRIVFWPLRFLRFRYAHRCIQQLLVPLLVGVAVGVATALSPWPVVLFGETGFVSLGLNLLGLLAGFYIGLLGIFISVGDSGRLDSIMGGHPEPTAPNPLSTSGAYRRITHREFLCALHGFQAFVALTVYVIGSFASAWAGGLRNVVPVGILPVLRGVCAGGMTLVLANLVLNSMLALYWLSDYAVRWMPPEMRARHQAARAGKPDGQE